MYRRAGGELSPSPRRACVGPLPPPPSPPLPTATSTTAVIDRDAKALQEVLQQMDETFHAGNNEDERRSRLHQLEERQMALQRLCEAALRQDETHNGHLKRHESGIVSTPRSVENYLIYEDPAAVAYSVARSTSRNGICSTPLLAPPPPMLPPRAVVREATSTIEVTALQREESSRDRPQLQPTQMAPASKKTIPGSKPLHPLPSPMPLPDGAALQEDRRLVEAFLSAAQAETCHPYAMKEEGEERCPPLRPVPLQLRRVAHQASENGVALERGTSQENFDVKEDEQLIKLILRRVQPPPKGPLQENSTVPAANHPNSVSAHATDATSRREDLLHKLGDGTSDSSSGTRLPNKSKGHRRNEHAVSPRLEVTAARGEDEEEEEEEAPSSAVGELHELVHENHALQRELETQDGALRELTQKTESLARHLVKAMRERAQLQYRKERLEELLEAANAEVRRLQQVAEVESKAMCGVAGLRAALHAKERELRICEEELLRLRGIVEQRVTRSGNIPMQRESTAVLAQVNGDVEELIEELAAAHIRQHEAEAHAKSITEELEAAQTHIHLLDNRLAEAEKAAVAQRLREMQERLLSGGELTSLPSSSLPSSTASPPLPVAEDVATWPATARRELARLASHAEGLVLRHAESDRHAELRLSHARRDNDELRTRCRAHEAELKALEAEAEVLRRERAAWKLCERRWHQQLLDVKDDAVMLLEVLQSTGNSAEKVLRSLATGSGDRLQVPSHIERFVKNVLRDLETTGRFLTALQWMDLATSPKQEQKQQRTVKPILSAATKARRDFVLRAVKVAMMSDASPPSRTQQQFEAVPEPLPQSPFAQQVQRQGWTVMPEADEGNGKERSSLLGKSGLTSDSFISRLLQWQEDAAARDTTSEERCRAHTQSQPSDRMKKRKHPLAAPIDESSRRATPSPCGIAVPSPSSQKQHLQQVGKLPPPPPSGQTERQGTPKRWLPPPPLRAANCDDALSGGTTNPISSTMGGATEKSSSIVRGLRPSANDAVVGAESACRPQVNNEADVCLVKQSPPRASPSHSSCCEEVEEVVELLDREKKPGTSCVVSSLPSFNDNVNQSEGVCLPSVQQDPLRQTPLNNSHVQSSDAVSARVESNSVSGLVKYNTEVVAPTRATQKASEGNNHPIEANGGGKATSATVALVDDSSEPRLHMTSLRKNGPQQQQQQHQSLSNDPPQQQQQQQQQQKKENSGENLPISSETSGSVTLQLPDSHSSPAAGAGHVPSLSRPTTGGRSDVLAPSLPEPRQSTVRRPSLTVPLVEAPTTITLPVAAKTTAPPMQQAQASTAPPETVGHVSEPPRRSSVTMDFPSVRHPTLGPGKRRVGEGEESEASATAPDAD